MPGESGFTVAGDHVVGTSFAVPIDGPALAVETAFDRDQTARISITFRPCAQGADKRGLTASVHVRPEGVARASAILSAVLPDGNREESREASLQPGLYSHVFFHGHADTTWQETSLRIQLHAMGSEGKTALVYLYNFYIE